MLSLKNAYIRIIFVVFTGFTKLYAHNHPGLTPSKFLLILHTVAPNIRAFPYFDKEQFLIIIFKLITKSNKVINFMST